MYFDGLFFPHTPTTYSSSWPTVQSKTARTRSLSHYWVLPFSQRQFHKPYTNLKLSNAIGSQTLSVYQKVNDSNLKGKLHTEAKVSMKRVQKELIQTSSAFYNMECIPNIVHLHLHKHRVSYCKWKPTHRCLVNHITKRLSCIYVFFFIVSFQYVFPRDPPLWSGQFCCFIAIGGFWGKGEQFRLISYWFASSWPRKYSYTLKNVHLHWSSMTT